MEICNNYICWAVIFLIQRWWTWKIWRYNFFCRIRLMLCWPWMWRQMNTFLCFQVSSARISLLLRDFTYEFITISSYGKDSHIYCAPLLALVCKNVCEGVGSCSSYTFVADYPIFTILQFGISTLLNSWRVNTRPYCPNAVAQKSQSIISYTD